MADLDWLFSITDKVTAPFKAMGKASEAFEKRMSAAEKHLDRFSKATGIKGLATKLDAPLRKAGAAMAKLGSAMKTGVSDKMKKLGGGGASIGGVMSLLGGGFAVAAGAALAFAGGVAMAGKALAEYAFEAAAGKRAQLTALGVFDFDNAAKVKDTLEEMSKNAGVNADKFGDMYLQLRGAGFAAKQAQTLLAAAADVSAFSGGGAKGQESSEKFIDLMSKVQVLAKTAPKDLMKLSQSAGIAPELLAESLGKRMGMSADAAQALLEKGGADSVKIQESILDVIQERGGGNKLGTFAKTFAAGSAQGQFEALKTSWNNVFEDVQIEKPIAEAIAKIRTKLDEGGWADKIKRGLELLPPILDKIITFAFQVFDAFEAAFDSGMVNEVTAGFSEMEKKLGLVGGGADAAKDVGKAIARLAEFAVIAAAAVKTLLLALERAFELGTKVANLGAGPIGEKIKSFMGIGTKVVNGVGVGVLKQQAVATEAGTKVANFVEAGVRDELEIRSPSRVMERLGEMVPLGFAKGVNSGEGLSGSLVNAPALSDVVTRGGSSLSLVIGDINVNGVEANDARSVARSIREQVRGELISMVEELAIV